MPNLIKVNPEYASMIRTHTISEYELLKKSIKENGLLVPIVINTKGEILDGHHRFRACSDLGLTPKYVIHELPSKLEEILFIYELALVGRQLSQHERIQLALKAEPYYQEQAKKRQLATLRQGKEALPPSIQNENNGEPGRVNEICARMAGVSPATYAKAKFINRNGTAEQKKALSEGKASTNELYIAIKKKENEVLFESPATCLKIPDQALLVHGDYRYCDDKIPNESANLVLTDHVFLRNDHLACADYCRFAFRMLEEGGYLVVNTTPDGINNILGDVTSAVKEFRYKWLLAAETEEGYSFEFECRFRPMLLYTKGVRKLEQKIPDLIETNSKYSFEKRYEIQEYLIKNLTVEGGLVCDPMCAFGDAGEIAFGLKRRFVGIEADRDLFESAYRKLSRYKHSGVSTA